MFREQEHRQERIGLGMTLWPAGPTKVEEANEIEIGNLHESGGGPSQVDGFAKLLATSKDKLEEKFRNIEIRQGGRVGLVTFNYDFVIHDKVHHSGLEVWEVCKIDGQWRSLAVAWTIYP